MYIIHINVFVFVHMYTLRIRRCLSNRIMEKRRFCFVLLMTLICHTLPLKVLSMSTTSAASITSSKSSVPTILLPSSSTSLDTTPTTYTVIPTTDTDKGMLWKYNRHRHFNSPFSILLIIIIFLINLINLYIWFRMGKKADVAKTMYYLFESLRWRKKKTLWLKAITDIIQNAFL